MHVNDLPILYKSGFDFRVQEKEVHFRAPHLIWYQNHPGGYTAITMKRFEEMSIEEVKEAVTHSFNVEQMTRVTGYYSKVRGWNPGKRAELRDRSKHNV